MAKKIDRLMKYFKCPNCGKDWSSDFVGGTLECECKTKLYYDELLENQWLNEVNDKGERIRLDFEGISEQDCRKKAAKYFNCEKEDITYHIVQKSGLFKKFIICATRPIHFETDPDTVKVVMWEYENRPKIWADINLEKKTILYPYVLGNEKQSFEKIVGLKKTEDTGACRAFKLVLEPQGEIEFNFYPGYFGDIDTLIQIANENCEPVNHGMFIERLSARFPFDVEQDAYLEISCGNYSLNGRIRSWKKDDKICFLNTDKFQGIDILIDKIKYFRLIGQKYVTTEITGGGGGGSSLKGAVIGGLIAGDIGAVVGSRKAIDEVKGTSTVHDEQIVLLYSTDLKQVITFNSNAYGILTKLIPEKEYEVVVQSTKEESQGNEIQNAADAVREYKKLLDEGIISMEEFEKKKKELLAL